VVLIVAFCAGLGVYFYIARRKRRAANARDSYEFDLIPDQEEARLMGGGAKGGKGGKRRAGELYDAFAAGSEDEDEFFHESDDDDVMVGGSGSGSGSGERSPFYRDKAGSAEEVAPRPERQRLELRDEEHHVLGDDSGSDGEGESHDEKR
jgi:kexin